MSEAGRVAWIDYAKGICIILIVMMHSTLGVQQAAGGAGWLGHVVDFARPFRMPDFFLIAGLFLSRVIDRDWRTYLDRKVVHYAYFYFLWLTIEFVTKAPAMVADGGWSSVAELYLLSFVEPFSTLWFIYILAIFFVAAKLLRRVPAWIVLPAAAVLEILPIQTGSTVVNEFAERFVYFYAGYVFAPLAFRIASAAIARSGVAGLALLGWAAVNGGLVLAGVATWPLVGLFLGFSGSIAVITVSALLSKSDVLAVVRYCGVNSLVIYLAFFLPAAAARSVLLRLDLIPDIGTVSLLVTAAGVIGSLAMWWAVRGTPLRLVFERPAWAMLRPSRARLVAAE